MKNSQTLVVARFFVVFAVAALVLPAAVLSAGAEARENLQQLLRTRACRNCNLSGLDLNRLDLQGVDLRGADLSGASCKLTNLSGADLTKARLNGVSFDGADLGEADLRGADLRGARFDSAFLGGVKTSEKLVVEDESESLPAAQPAVADREQPAAPKKQAEVRHPAPPHPAPAQLHADAAKKSPVVAGTGRSLQAAAAVGVPKTPPVAASSPAVPAKLPVLRATQKKRLIHTEGEHNADGILILRADRQKRLPGTADDDSTASIAELTRKGLQDVAGGYVTGSDQRLPAPELTTPGRLVSEGRHTHFSGLPHTSSLATPAHSEAPATTSFTGTIAPAAKPSPAVSEVQATADETAETDAAAQRPKTVPFVQQRTNSVKEMSATPAVRKVLASPAGVETAAAKDKEQTKAGSRRPLHRRPVVPSVADKKRAQLELLMQENNCYGCDLAGLSLSGRNLEKADLEAADLSGCDLSGANLSGANLKAANLRGAVLRGADLRGVDFYKADLAGADFAGSKVKGASFDGANMHGALGIKKKRKKK